MVNPIKIIKGASKAITTGKAKANKKNVASKHGSGMMTPPTLTKGKVKDFNKNSQRAVTKTLTNNNISTRQAYNNYIAKEKKITDRINAQSPPYKAAKVPIKKKAGKK